MATLFQRPRRRRYQPGVRSLVQESFVMPQRLIAPLFIVDGPDVQIEIKAMPGQFRLGRGPLIDKVKKLYSLGVRGICLFPVVNESLKDSRASYALDKNCFYYNAIKEIKDLLPDMAVMTDIALDPYSSDGHDGLVDPKSGEVLNDQTLEILAQMGVMQASAGADILGPSDMMDGRVGIIRKSLEENGHYKTSIMSYSAKYASSFYGPFRDALDSAPKSGDKKTYQMGPTQRREALEEGRLDVEQGADILMVKPGLPYLDIISDFNKNFDLPIAAYNVSGEYSMVMAAGRAGLLDINTASLEMMQCFFRAGAHIVLTYFAESIAEQLREGL